jgi:hypothetical protein
MKNDAKVLQKLLKDPSILDPSTRFYRDFLDTLLEHKINEQEGYEPILKDKVNYIGIEVECFSPLGEIDVLELVLAHDLEDHINITDDGSIDPDNGESSYEFRILSTEKELPTVFKKLKAFFKEGKFNTNETCGLHVHLDMRNRNVNKCYEKLLKFQHIIFPLVDHSRWINEYCGWSTKNNKEYRRMTAINYTAYDKHKTIEVRLHQGTTNVRAIENWVKLLLKAIESAPVKEINSKADAIRWAAKDKQLKSYIRKEFDSAWFKSKDKVMDGYKSRNDDGDYDPDVA